MDFVPQVEHREVEFRYGFSFPWMLLPSILQDDIDSLERSLALHDLCDDAWFGMLEGDLSMELFDVGAAIIYEICDRYGLCYPYQFL